MALAWQNLSLELNLRQALIKLFFMDTMAMGDMTYTMAYIQRDLCSRKTNMWVPRFHPYILVLGNLALQEREREVLCELALQLKGREREKFSQLSSQKRERDFDQFCGQREREIFWLVWWIDERERERLARMEREQKRE